MFEILRKYRLRTLEIRKFQLQNARNLIIMFCSVCGLFVIKNPEFSEFVFEQSVKPYDEASMPPAGAKISKGPLKF